MEYGYSCLCAIVFLSSQIQTIQINITISSAVNHANLHMPAGTMWPAATGFHLLLSQLYTTDFHSSNSLEGQRCEIRAHVKSEMLFVVMLNIF